MGLFRCRCDNSLGLDLLALSFRSVGNTPSWLCHLPIHYDFFQHRGLDYAENLSGSDAIRVHPNFFLL